MVSIWYTRVNLHTNWLKIIFFVFQTVELSILSLVSEHQYRENHIKISPKFEAISTLLTENLGAPGNSLAVLWLGLWASIEGGPGSIPGQGTKIPETEQLDEKKKKSRNPKFQTLSVYAKWIFVCLSCLFVSNGSSCDALNDYAKVLVDYNNLWKILKEMGIPDHLTCLLRNLYAGQEATEANMDWFKTGKGVHQSCVLSPCLFNLDAEYIIWNAGLN